MPSEPRPAKRKRDLSPPSSPARCDDVAFKRSSRPAIESHSAASESTQPLTRAALRALNTANGDTSREKRWWEAGNSNTMTEDEARYTEETGSKARSAYDAGFENELELRGICHLHISDRRQPHDLDAFEKALSRARGSPQPDRTDIGTIHRTTDGISNEAAVISGITPIVLPLNQIVQSEDRDRIEQKPFTHSMCIPAPPRCIPLVRPAPDIALGYTKRAFTQKLAITRLEVIAAPIAGATHVLFPTVAVEGKGPGGDLRVANLQCEWDAANMIYCKTRLCEKNEPARQQLFDKIQAISVSITDQIISCRYHWPVKTLDGGIQYLSKVLNAWALCTTSEAAVQERHRVVRNAIDYVFDQSQAWLQGCLSQIEDGVPFAIPTPPSTQRPKLMSPKKRKLGSST